MHNHDQNRVQFHSKEDMAGVYQLTKGEHILRSHTQSNYTDINDVLEVYNVKKYLDNDLFLKNWTQEDIVDFKQKAIEYGKVIGQFISNINDNNIVNLYEKVLRGYVNSFWELVNNQNAFKQISRIKFSSILSKEPHLIRIILTHKQLVDFYDTEIKNFLLTYSQSAEILLSIYEQKNDFLKKQRFVPKSLTLKDKESIVSNYLDSKDINLNYITLIQNLRNKSDFKISDKIRLKAKRLNKSETEKFFSEINGGMKYGVSINFPENAPRIKDGYIDNSVANYSYSLDFIKQNSDSYSLFYNFKILFEYLDVQNRISLVSKKNQMGVMERIMGIHSENEYRGGIAFSLSEMTSHVQIISYNKIVRELNNSLENILNYVFTSAFHEKYGFAPNAHLSTPSTNSYFEKVRLLAPEFESVLKQFKLFVEDGFIDFELLQISSSPSPIKDIPSLNKDKYIYLNEKNEEIIGCSNLFFSDQTVLAFVEPHKEKYYDNFFELLANELVSFSHYEEHQKPEINYLINKGFISINSNGFIDINNPVRLLILKDLYNNEVASFYNYPIDFQKEAQQMAAENIISFDCSLFSKPEQAYFNYFLNKSEFSNGLDLRNSYLHGTQASPDEIKKHEYSYFTYLKLLVLVMLKVEDDLVISNKIKSKTEL